jgi:hypothetical protein
MFWVQYLPSSYLSVELTLGVTFVYQWLAKFAILSLADDYSEQQPWFKSSSLVLPEMS